MAEYLGIDVSEHNGIINWEKVKASGVQFAMIRAGYGQGNIDKRFQFNISECNRLGIPCGVYWFSYALNATAAKREAQYVLGAIKPYKLEYPIAFDFEYDSVEYAKKKGVTITKALASDITRAFCNEIEAAKFYALNYTNQDYLSRYFDADVAAKYGIWLASWNNKAQPPRDCQIWQYTSSGKVDGISGNVDMNKCYIDFPAKIKSAGLNGFKSEVKTMTDTEKAEQWAVNVGLIKGYGNGNYGWKDALTRGQMAMILYRFYELLKSGKL